jgi:hypothetical protein
MFGLVLEYAVAQTFPWATFSVSEQRLAASAKPERLSGDFLNVGFPIYQDLEAISHLSLTSDDIGDEKGRYSVAKAALMRNLDSARVLHAHTTGDKFVLAMLFNALSMLEAQKYSTYGETTKSGEAGDVPSGDSKVQSFDTAVKKYPWPGCFVDLEVTFEQKQFKHFGSCYWHESSEPTSGSN